MAVAQELQAARTGSAPVELPPEVVRANNIIRSAPYADEAARAFRDIASGSEITTPEQEMDRRKALQEKYGIRAPGEDELARIAASEKAYERDRQERAQYQAMKTLAESARPNIYGRYMPGTAAGATSAFGLANLEADRTYRDLNEKAKVAAKESQRAFELGNLNDAIALANKSKEFDRESRKIAASGFGQMASSATTAQSQQLSTQENARYHDMWENMENKKLKADIARTAASLQINAPELLKVVEGIKKSMPQLASKMTDGQLLDYAAGKIAESRGAEDRSESAYNQALRARDEKISAAIQTKPTVMNARSKLDKAMKSGSQVDIDQAERDLLQAVARERRIIEAGMTPLIKPSRPGEGIASPAAPANPNAGQPTIKYDIKGNRVVTPSPIPQ